jgi:hypothetical protein
MRITILPFSLPPTKAINTLAPCVPSQDSNRRTYPPLLRLIAENAAEEAQIAALLTQLKANEVTVSQYGQPTSADYMAVGLEVELA